MVIFGEYPCHFKIYHPIVFSSFQGENKKLSSNNKGESMQNEIEPLVKKHLGKEVNRIAQDQVREMLNSTKIKNKFSNFEIEDEDDDDDDSDDSFIVEEEDEVEPVSTRSNDYSTPHISDAEADKTLARIEAREAFDLFNEVGDYWEKRGQTVRYDINKGNKLLTKRDHPYSWEEIQKEFGGGTYKVMARLPSDGNRYLKAQSKALHSAPETSPDYLLKSLMDKNKTLEDRVINSHKDSGDKSQAVPMMEILETVRRNNEASIEQANRMRQEANVQAERARQEAKEEARLNLEMYEKMMEKNRPQVQPDILSQLTPLLTAILPSLLNRPAPIAPIVADNSKFQMDMMMKMQQMNMDMMEKNNEANREMFRNLQESVRDLAKKEAPVQSEKSLSAFEMYEKLKEAENRGFEQMQMLNELAKERANERDELRGDRTPSDVPAEKESTMDTVIKSMIPLLASKMAQPSAPQAPRPLPLPTPMARPIQRQASQVIPQQQRSVSPTGQGIRSNEVRANRTSVQANQARANEGYSEQSETGSKPSTQVVLNVPAIEAPAIPKVVDFLNSGNDDFTPREVRTHEAPQSHEAPQAPIVVIPKNQANSDLILSLVYPVAITGYSTEGSTIQSIADSAITELEANGIDLSTVERDFDEDALSGIISILPDDLQNLTRDLRNGINSEIHKRLKR